jgi:hypothetical protein
MEEKVPGGRNCSGTTPRTGGGECV